VAVAALAVGPFIYRSLLPGAAAAPAAGCSFGLVLGGLFALLAAATIWLLRRRRHARRPELDRKLWEAALGRDEPAEPGEDG
jgi:hypothetical protein